MSDSASTISKDLIEVLTGFEPKEPGLYEQGLRHGSLVRGEPDGHLISNERLEYLGDSLLNFVVADALYRQYPDRDEGFLTRVRAGLVNGIALAEFARWVGLGPHIQMSSDMVRAGGRDNDSILADAFEAVVGAIYLDHGHEAARAFLHRVIFERIDIEAVAVRRDNFKSLLLEFAQARSWPQPSYRVIMEDGPAHARTFTVEVIINGDVLGKGQAASKKKAEQQAASLALEAMRNSD
jgi:ribonuclease III